ncbi:MAG: protein kinase [Chromatiales bacterium]|nr:protein kinase [Chromatiales bacterium]
MMNPLRRQGRIWARRDFWLATLALLFLLGSWTSGLQWFESRLYDEAARLIPETEPGDAVVVIAIDEAAEQRYGSWPWSRARLAEVVARLGDARAVGFLPALDQPETPLALETVRAEITEGREALLARRDELRAQAPNTARRQSLERVESGLDKLATASYWLGKVDTDRQLATAIRQHGQVVLVAEYAATRSDRTAATGLHPLALEPATDWYLSGPLRLLASPPSEPGPLSLREPIEAYAAHARAIGAQPLWGDGERVRALTLAVPQGEARVPSFVTVLAAVARGVPLEDLAVLGEHGLRLGFRDVATGMQHRFHPLPPVTADGEPPVPVYSAAALLEGRIPSAALRDRTVLIGPTAPGAAPRLLAPAGGELAPVLWTAHGVASLIEDRAVTQPTWFHAAQRGLILLLALFLLALPARVYGGSSALLVVILVEVILLNASLLSLILARYWLPLGIPMLFLAVGYGALVVRHRIVDTIARSREEAFEARRLLGVNLHAQGQLDRAFDEFRKCRRDADTLYHLYQLGQDYERRRKFTRALEVYEYMAQAEPGYRDIGERIRRLKAVPDGNTARFLAPESAIDSTLVLDDSAIEKPMLGRYRLEAQIGRGAMGVVYLGIDPKIGRKVAIKTLNLTQEFEGTELEEVKWRFYREAEASGRLDHRNIVTVYDVGEEHDLAYIAMDFVPGHSLDETAREGSLLPVDEVLDIGIQVAEALDYAHKQQVIHRDIKPANMLYEPDERMVKLTDFGIARLIDNSKTRTGTLLGTPAYMAPEQITSQDVDGRADLYSLGVTLFQLLTGQLPFTSDSMANLVFKITSEKAPDLRSIRPELGADLARVVAKALHKEPDKRYQSGANMAAALRRVREQA